MAEFEIIPATDSKPAEWGLGVSSGSLYWKDPNKPDTEWVCVVPAKGASVPHGSKTGPLNIEPLPPGTKIEITV